MKRYKLLSRYSKKTKKNYDQLKKKWSSLNHLERGAFTVTMREALEVPNDKETT